jgi:hypothetical protein
MRSLSAHADEPSQGVSDRPALFDPETIKTMTQKLVLLVGTFAALDD